MISVGAGNDYGHPSPLLLAELARLGVPVARTDQQGDIAVVSQGRPAWCRRPVRAAVDRAARPVDNTGRR